MVFYNTAIIFLFFSLLSCSSRNSNDENFYTKKSQYSGVSRLPIIEPYELITTDCCSDWHIGRFSKIGKVFDLETDIDSISYTDGKIYIYNKDYKTNPRLKKDHFYVLKIKDSTLIEYFTYEEFISNHKVIFYSPEYAYYYIKNHMRTPW